MLRMIEESGAAVMPSELSRLERAALALGEFLNERPRPKELQSRYLKRVSHQWMRASVRNLRRIDGAEHLRALPRPDRGVLVVSNHRSFFDQYVIMSTMVDIVGWCDRMTFPVRSNFFYERWSGIAVNLFMGGGSMYPPIFRDPAKAELNKSAIQKITDLLQKPGDVLGMHPEGTRGKGPDPYVLLPAQPGVGQVIMKARPIVLPVFVNGLSNDLVEQVVANFKDGGRGGTPVYVLFGPPVELDDLLAGKPRPAQYKRVADRCLDAVRVLAERERELRSAADRDAGAGAA